MEHPRYDAAHGGLPYFCAYMIAMVIGECINFPIQRNFVFRSKGNLAKQIGWYVLAFCIITCIVNSINCIWVAVAGLLVPDFIYNIGTTVLNGGISMVIFFFVNKIIFPERKSRQIISYSLSFSSFHHKPEGLAPFSGAAFWFERRAPPQSSRSS